LPYIAGFMALLGTLSGLAYARYRAGTAAGVVAFSLAATAMLELPRIWYITNQRLAAVGVLLVVGWLRFGRLARVP
jgi:hypothetical protein